MDQQQTPPDADGFHTMRITLGYELSATHAWLEFPFSTTGVSTLTSTASPSNSSSDIDDPDYDSAWNFQFALGLVRGQQSKPERVQQVTLTEEPIDTTILLEDQPWYHDEIVGIEAESILKQHDLYSFLVRKSTTSVGSYVVSVKISDNARPYCTHIRIIRDKEKGYTFGDSVNSPFFNSVPACIYYCTRNKFSLCNDSIRLQTSARPLANPVPRSL